MHQGLVLTLDGNGVRRCCDRLARHCRAGLATATLLVPSPSRSWTWPSSRPPSTTPSRPSTDGTHPITWCFPGEPPAHPRPPPPRPHMMCSSTSCRARPPRSTRPTTNTWPTHGLAENDPGVSIGAVAAAGILALRANDGRVTKPAPSRPSPAVLPPANGVRRPRCNPPPPPSLAPMAMPWLRAVPPFTLKSGDQFRAKPPPPLSSQQYTKDYDEVKALGALINSTRTPEQTQLANFFAGNIFILCNHALRDVAAAHTHNIGDNARLLALGTIAIADAVIACWDSK